MKKLVHPKHANELTVSVRRLFNNILFFSFLASLLFTLACNSASESSEDTFTDSVASDELKGTDINRNQVVEVLFDLPSPVEMVKIVEKARVRYNPSLLNPTDNFEQYITATSLSLNLGVYGVDLGYLRAFNQMQQSLNYITVVKRMVGRLGIPDNNSAQIFQLIENNDIDKNKVFAMLQETYANADSYLRDNDRESTASLIVLGSWIEGLYISTQLYEKQKTNTYLMNRIAEQKLSLNKIIELLSNNQDNKAVEEFLPSLIVLQKVYSGVDIKYDAAKIDTTKKVIIISENEQCQITMQQIENITAMVSSIRHRIINY